MIRPSWSETWLTVVDLIALRSACCRRQAGCVIVNDNRVIGTGYNGPAAGFRNLHQDDDCSAWCPRGMAPPEDPRSYADCVAIHAEANALLYSDASARKGGLAYCNTCPCYTCSQMLANSGLFGVVCSVGAHDRDREPEKSILYMEKSGLRVVVYRALTEFREAFMKAGIRPQEWVDADPA